VWEGSDGDLASQLEAAGAEVIEGPVARDGGRGRGTSTYVRDPDGNLLEFIIYG
jgi:catechol 2,3-dioxygenase-like lactoylglutathione lyase family enzyme